MNYVFHQKTCYYGPEYVLSYFSKKYSACYVFFNGKRRGHFSYVDTYLALIFLQQHIFTFNF